MLSCAMGDVSVLRFGTKSGKKHVFGCVILNCDRVRVHSLKLENNGLSFQLVWNQD